MILENYQKDLQLFRRNRYRSKRLKSYFARFSKDDNTILIDPYVRDVLLAQGISVEESPRSIYSVEKLFEALSHYAPGKIPKPKPCAEFTAGVALAYKCFARKRDQLQLHILPMTPETIVYITSNPSGSPGVTNFGCTKAESQTRALERGIQTVQGEKKPEPCLAFKRTQFNEKTRLVWGYPYSMTFIEGLVAKPLLEQFKGGCSPMAFAMSTGALGTKLRVASYHKEWAYSLDMSQYDATISAQLIHIAFKILRTWFDEAEVEPVSGKTVGQIFNLIEKYFIHTPIIMPDGNVYYGKEHGVPSGSYFTQLVDSIVNVIIGGTISAKFNMHVSRREIFVLGDDLLMWSNRLMDLDVIAKYANEQFGVRLHGSEKSKRFHYDETIHYLGRDWTNGLPDLPEEEIVKRMVYPESFRKYAKDPDDRKRQVHMMLLAYAGTYRSAWRIAYRAIDSSDRNVHRGCGNTDVNVYIREGRKVELTPEHMSGLMRFLFREHMFGDTGDIPITAIQYWL
uniref:RNA-dependent RNA polymerase n=1 Tax=Puddy partiti-like virus TaxID=2716663 RepID=A0A6G7PS49_9VIRU|nr:RNA-dependent RNA polymerase [Puddy partiti-like virus]